MTSAPSEFDGDKVVATAVIDGTVRPTGVTVHRGPDGVIPSASALAIVESETSFYLLYCDREWQVLTDTWHLSVSEAKAQAEFEYAGISKVWKDAVLTPAVSENNPMGQMTNDPFDLERFVTAQEPIYEQALAELRAGSKRTHWSWFILPQMRGLGFSSMSVRYGIGSLDEAKAYLAHPLLGPRLRECVSAMNSHTGLSASQILGSIDAQKFRSCVTLFIEASEHEVIFTAALAKYFGGSPDQSTLSLLAGKENDEKHDSRRNS